MKKICRVVCLVAVLFSCSSLLATDNDKIQISVSILPQAGILKSIGGKCVNVNILIRKGQEPHAFSPSPKQILLLGKSKIYFISGMPFESILIDKLKSANIKIIDMSAGIKRHSIAKSGHHGELHSHTHGISNHTTPEEDPHIWMSIKNIKHMAKNACQALIATMPNQKDYFEANLKLFLNRANEVDLKLKKVLKPFKGRTFFVFHPAFSYFANDYGLRQEAVEIDGKSPLPRHLSILINLARKDGVKIVFVQPQFSSRAAKAIAKAIGGKVVPVDPLAENTLDNFLDISNKLKKDFER